ncbi:hypothetical protein P691DRAFT_108282 [Macrolepiota fuliginosa MF-IS2]|uniref:Uncharacterized protein n=1 Tax=Macrolepiota fuliginosa MF-IS2 TaxID=1400762 RepID=A0A9P5XAN5_9AGAR|nr:hypothetical protein P691DRAFT_108282 [Macrolepiota fuliginosa MF-IS2]
MKTRRQPAFSSSLTNQASTLIRPSVSLRLDDSYKNTVSLQYLGTYDGPTEGPTDLRTYLPTVDLIYVGVSYLIRVSRSFPLFLSLVSRPSLKPQRLSDAVVLAPIV